MKYLNIETYGRNHRICFYSTAYTYNGNLAVFAYEDTGEPFADVTVNFDFLEVGCAYLDTNNFPEIEDVLIREGIAKSLDRYKRSGYWDYPLYEFDMEKLAEFSMLGSDYFLL